MPTIDLGSVVGPQGSQGNTGPAGPQGVAGPSLISASTQTTLTGVLAGDGNTVGVRAVDATPTNLSTNLVQSGGVYSALAESIIKADLSSTSVLPRTVNNAAITSKHILLKAELGTPVAQKGTWTVTTNDGSFTISGTIGTATTMSFVFGLPGITI